MKSKLDINESKAPEKEKVTRWSKRVTIGDETTTIEVEKIENGYLITKSRDYRDSTGAYMYETKKMFSKTNPLEAEALITKDTDGLKAIRDLFLED